MPDSHDLSARVDATAPLFNWLTAGAEYAVDAAQRSVLFWDVMRQRGNQYREHKAENAPNVLDYKAELVIDGRTLQRPVNYRAGAHRTAGRRRDRSEAPTLRHRRSARRSWPGHRRLQGRQRDRRRASRPVIPATSSASFPSRCRARPSRISPAPKRSFIERVIALHPQADGKPCVIGNCQAGWAVMMLAAAAARAVRPDHHRRLAAVLLGGRPRQKSDAL